MASERIEKLLEKYFAAETALSEERELRDYFSTSNVSENLKQYVSLFTYAEQERAQVPGEDFESRILKIVEPNKRSTGLMKRLVYPLSIAASVVLFVVVFNAVQHHRQDSKRNIVYSEMKDKDLAYAQTKQTLLYVSSKLNKGLKEVHKVSKFNQATEKIANNKKP